MAGRTASTASNNAATASGPSFYEQAVKHACSMRYHQSLRLPATDKHGALRVTFSTTSNFGDTSLPAALFVGPMFGSRWHALQAEHISKDVGVRIIFTDRPGMGGSTSVPLDQRVPVWLETVPPLLQQLKVEHVSLLTHSAGTIYMLNTIYHSRNLLDPEKPYAALMAPWVQSSHSNATLMKIASNIPSSVIGGWDGLNRLIQQRINPTLGWSGGAISAVTGLFNKADVAPTESPSVEAKKFDVGEPVAKELEELITKYFFAEVTNGTSDEARLCLRKGGPGLWGICEDYEEYVKVLVKKEKAALAENAAGGEQRKLRIQAFFAESDIMIGKGGQEYFKKCWQKTNLDAAIDFESFEIAGTNHETLLVDQENGCLRQILEEIKGIRALP